MGNENVDKTLESRPPDLSDLINLCRELNKQQAKYIVIGGIAIIQAGYTREKKILEKN